MSVILALLKLPFLFLLEVIYFIFRCRPKKVIKNQHILITGAGQGIGEQFARQFAAMGNTVHCVDIEEKLVQDLVEELKGKGHQAYSYRCDLTKHEQVQELYNDITSAGFIINILVNNAGVAFGRGLHDMTFTQIQHSMTVNIVSNLWLIKLFLPKMLDLNEGHVVNIASLAGIFPVRSSTDYCAAKAGSIHAMNQLRMGHMQSNVKFTAVCPYFVKTKFITGMNQAIAISADSMVEQAILGIRENRELVIIPKRFELLKVFHQFAPTSLKNSFMVSRGKKGNTNEFVGQRMSEKIQ